MNSSRTVTSAETESADVFYWINGYPVTYSYFAINIAILVAHLVIIAINSLMIAALRQTKKVEEPGGHCLISTYD